LADESFGKAIFGIFVAVDEVVAAERAPDGLERCRPRLLVDRDADPVMPDLSQVDAVVDGVLHDQSLIGADLPRDGVKERLRPDLEAERGQSVGKTHRLAVDTLGNRLQPLRAMEYC